jgi:hypothetical protein
MPTMRQTRRAIARRVAAIAQQIAYSEHMHAQAALDDDFDGWDGDDAYVRDRDLTCRHCDGTGGDRWNDGIMPCEHCDGEGYEWWQ